MAERKLGRGLDGLMESIGAAEASPGEAPERPLPSTALPVELIDPNPHQPRRGFDAEELGRLADSIRQHGVLQPLVVRPHGERYQVVAGERRLRAAQAAGLAEVPVVVRDVRDQEMLEIALIENLQREDLDPIEKAESFQAYLDTTSQTQDQASKRLGIDRASISNFVRLLELPEDVRSLIRSGRVAMGHARALLTLRDPARQVSLAQRAAREGLSVRQIEQLVAAGFAGKRRIQARARPPKSPHVRAVETRLREVLGTKVDVKEGRKPGSGRITIEFYSADDLDRILRVLRGRPS